MSFSNDPEYTGGEDMPFNGQVCKGVFRVDSPFYLWNVKSFKQYCIPYENRSRIFTVVGENHINDINDTLGCPVGVGSVMDYIQKIHETSSGMNKNMHVLLEMPGSEDVVSSSSNIRQTLAYTSQHDISNSIDIRYMGGERYNRIRDLAISGDMSDMSNMSQISPSDLLWMLEGCDEIHRLLVDLVQRPVFLQDHLIFLRKLIVADKDEFDSIESQLLSLNSQDSDPTMELVYRMFYLYSILMDTYILTQVFTKEIPYDHIILLIGDAHAGQIFHLMRYFHIYEGIIDHNNVMSVSGSFF
jgi:hypothetical protein